MIHDFDKQFWEDHWKRSVEAAPAHPALLELADLSPGTALDAGCGEGAEARWLASRGWRVTAVDIAAEALRRAAGVETTGEPVTWVEADLGQWHPDTPFDLVTTHYAHPAGSQLGFYERIAEWVAPGGTLLIVGHLGHGGVTLDAVAGILERWNIVSAEVRPRTLNGHTLDDVVVRATTRE